MKTLLISLWLFVLIVFSRGLPCQEWHNEVMDDGKNTVTILIVDGQKFYKLVIDPEKTELQFSDGVRV